MTDIATSTASPAVHSDVDVLGRAAYHLRRTLKEATPGPWTVSPIWWNSADVAYIALMDPTTGAALADWLDATNNDHTRVTEIGECPTCGSGPCGPHPDVELCDDCGGEWPCHPVQPAIALARIILGEV